MSAAFRGNQQRRGYTPASEPTSSGKGGVAEVTAGVVALTINGRFCSPRDKEAESATNEEAEPFAEDVRCPNDNNRAAAGSALPLATTIAVMSATGEDNEEDVEEGESGASKRVREREGGKHATVLEQAEGCSSEGTSM